MIYFLAGLALKGFIILLIAVLVVGLLRGSAAALRHRIWGATMVGLLVVPLVAAVMPTWQIAHLPLRSTGASPTSVGAPLEYDQRSRLEADGTAQASEGGERFATDVRSALRTDPSSSTWPGLLTLVWLCGVLFVLSRLVVEFLRILAVTRLADEVADVELQQMKNELTVRDARLRSVRLVSSDRSSVPLTWGSRRPVILLPADAHEWPASKQRNVLLHELAHIQRRDYSVHLLGQFALALHWFNPLAWYAVRRMLIEREKSCDDAAITAGADPADYAQILLHIATEMLAGPEHNAGALSMARASELESRVLSVLNADTRRMSVSRTSTFILAVAFMCMIPVLAGMQIWETAAGPAETNLLAMPIESTLVARGDTLPAHVRLAMQRLVDPDDNTRARSACDLGRWLVRPAIPLLIGLLGDDALTTGPRCSYHETIGWNPAHYVWKEATVGEAAALALAAIGGAAVERLTLTLHDSDPSVRRNAAWAIGEVRRHENQERATNDLLERLQDEDPWVRRTAAWALGEIRSPVSLDGLVAALHDTDWQVRRQAARALGELADESAEAELRIALSDESIPVQEMAQWALYEMNSRGN